MADKKTDQAKPAERAPAKVFRVNIPRSMAGERFVAASDEAAAVAAYMAECGIRSHKTPPTVTACEAPSGVAVIGG